MNINKKIQIKIISGNNSYSGEFDRGTSILSAIISAGFAENHTITTPCSGKRLCGKCRVLASGELDEITEHEKNLLGDEAVRNGFRLACAASALGDAEIILGAGSASAEIEVYGNQNHTYPHDPISSGYGAAVDIGTTTVAVYLVNLNSSEIRGTRAFINPQSMAGADVISRIQYTSENPGGGVILADLISSAISKAVIELSDEAGISPDDITSAVIAGNTVMEHFIANIDAHPISVAPFDPPSLFGEYYTPADLRLSNCIGNYAKIYLAPCVASYVGGDITAGAVAAGLRYLNANRLFIDVGTNGEIGLFANGKITFCATAAGPALEGAHIKCGMSALTGAISAVTLNGDNASQFQSQFQPQLRVSVIGGGTPAGICGSGIIDSAAVFLKLGLIDETGRVMSSGEVPPLLSRFTDEDGGKLYFGEDKSVYLTGGDIREIQLAKAAISAGILTLLHHAGIDPGEIHSVLLAGGFGSKINPQSACEIGLIPIEFAGKIKPCGNTAGMGAVMMLLSKSALKDAKNIAAESEYIELSRDSFFMDEFIERMAF